MGYLYINKINLETNNVEYEAYNEYGLTTDDDYDYYFFKTQEKDFGDRRSDYEKKDGKK